MEKKNRIICSACGAEYEENLPKCPYCELVNYKGAEKEYFSKLEAVREDMEELSSVPEEVAKNAIKKQTGNVLKIFIIVVVIVGVLAGISYVRNNLDIGKISEKEQFLWAAENYPKFDALYEEGKYEELSNLLSDALLSEYSVWDYEHYEFAFLYENIIDAKEMMRLIDSGENTSEHAYTRLLYNQVDLILQWEDESALSSEEREIIQPLMGEVVADFDSRWQMSEEEYDEVMKLAKDNYDILSYDDAEKFVKKWLKKRN